MDALRIGDGSVVADLGAGGGWFTVRLARRVGPNGRVYAEDIQPQMIESIERRVEREGLAARVSTTARHGDGSQASRERSLDAVLIVDAYHEMEQPVVLLRNLARSLKAEGPHRHRRLHETKAAARDRRWTSASIRSASFADAADAGLRLRRASASSRYQYMLVFERSWRRRQPRRDERGSRVLHRLPAARRYRAPAARAPTGQPVQQSMAYTVHAPSKRVRAVLTLLCAELCGGAVAARRRRRPPRSSWCTPRRSSSTICRPWTTRRCGGAARRTTWHSGSRSPSWRRSGCFNLAYGVLCRAYDPALSTRCRRC